MYFSKEFFRANFYQSPSRISYGYLLLCNLVNDHVMKQTSINNHMSYTGKRYIGKESFFCSLYTFRTEPKLFGCFNHSESVRSFFICSSNFSNF